MELVADSRNLTLEEMAKEFGVTRERVRQLINSLGLEPQKVRLDNRLEEAKQKRLVRPEQSWKVLIRNKAEELGLPISNIKLSGPQRLVNINGFICRLGSYYVGSTPKGRTSVKLNLHLFMGYDFYVVHGKIGWFVFPIGVLPIGAGTEFIMNPNSRYGATSFRHDYQTYLEAWHLLKEKKNEG